MYQVSWHDQPHFLHSGLLLCFVLANSLGGVGFESLRADRCLCEWSNHGDQSKGEVISLSPTSKVSEVNFTVSVDCKTGLGMLCSHDCVGVDRARARHIFMLAEQKCSPAKMLSHSLLLFFVLVSCAHTWFVCVRVLRIINSGAQCCPGRWKKKS